MTEDNKQSEEQITRAGAVELEETALDEAAGGLLPAVAEVPEHKFGIKFDGIVQKVAPEMKFAPGEIVGKKAF